MYTHTHTHRHDLSSRESDEGEEKNVDEYVFFNAINLKKASANLICTQTRETAGFLFLFVQKKKSVNQSGAAHRLLKLFTIFVHF